MNTGADQSSLVEQVVSAIRTVLGPGPAALHEPEFGGNEGRYLQECLDSTFVSSVGPFVPKFEAQLVAYTGAKHAVAVVNGTAALQVALIIAGVEPGDEVLIPALTFVGTANAVRHAGAIPHFVDSEEASLGLDPTSLRAHLQAMADMDAGSLRNRRTGRRIAAVVPVHIYGHPVDMDRLVPVCEEFGITLVEDAAESLGSFYRGRHTGSFGTVSSLSFNGNKIVTTGGGGALLTNNDELAARAKHLTTTAKKAHPWSFDHDAVAWNFRMPNINAALGYGQMEHLPDMLARKRELAARYQVAFRDKTGVRFVVEPTGCRSNYWLNTLLLEQPDISARDQLLSVANDAGYQCRPTWTLLHKLPMYADCPRASLLVAEQLEARLINLPSSAKLADHQQ